jgi:hypothetical protein
MHDVFAESVQLVFHNDGNTPVEFVRELLRGVFGLRQREAIAFSSLIDDRGKGGLNITVDSRGRLWGQSFDTSIRQSRLG